MNDSKLIVLFTVTSFSLSVNHCKLLSLSKFEHKLVLITGALNVVILFDTKWSKMKHLALKKLANSSLGGDKREKFHFSLL